MSDFKYAIRDTFQTVFENIEIKGCVFHFTKAVLSKVNKGGFKSDYKICPKFTAFVRGICSLPYVPLSRMAEGVRNLYILAKATGDERQMKFCAVLIRYVEKVWINGMFPPSSWNVYQHCGEATNNKSEGYNHRLNSRKSVSQHPNFFQFVKLLKTELKISSDEIIMAEQGNWPLGRQRQ